ncbi:MAG: hypothetical protein GWN58_54585 [Anaerolineae bacterium]|nr:hypothetical protein [Anaerolineae bacterium]
MPQHGYLQTEKGPEDMLGVTVRVVAAREGARDGYARWLVDFWPSHGAFNDDHPGFSGRRKSDIEERIVLHPNAFHAIKATRQEGQ